MESTAFSLTGYGPRRRLLFDGDTERYELWEIKFLGHICILNLMDGLNADEPDESKNAEVFAELVKLLDDRCVYLVMRDATDDGKNALVILVTII